MSEPDKTEASVADEALAPARAEWQELVLEFTRMAREIVERRQAPAEDYSREAMSQIQAFRERWQHIYDREASRWYQVGKEWKLGRTPEGHLSWDPYPKPLEGVITDYKAALAGMRQGREDRQQQQGKESHERHQDRSLSR